MKGCVIIQTCDNYSKFWPGLIYSMNKYWDFNIPWPIYFCNEEIPIDFGPNYKQLLTGKGSCIQNLKFILDSLQEYDYVFYMIEDFWPVNPMTHDMFMTLAELMHTHNWDSLRVSTFEPSYYKVDPTNCFYGSQRVFKMAKDSDWRFSQQAAFWKRDLFKQCLVEGEADSIHRTSLPSEIACDHFLRSNFPNSEIYHFHYYWYPMSGTVWRGELTDIGKQIEVIMNIESHINEMEKSLIEQ